MNKTVTRRARFRRAALITVACLLASAAAALPAIASARLPVLPPCYYHEKVWPHQSMTAFSKLYRVAPLRIIALTWSCGKERLSPRFRHYVDAGNWNRPLPAGITLVTGRFF